jgi:general stress protein 26
MSNKHMSYEEHLDEVTTQITERYAVSDEAAIKMVMQAQDAEYFSGHDDDPTLCTLEQAGRDAKYVFKTYAKKH